MMNLLHFATYERNLITMLISFLIILSGCAYFNTFYNAQSYYREARKLVVNDTLKIDSELFDKTIEKTTAIIVKYPQSRYVDDALFMMGASYYYKGDYRRALEKLDFLCLNYPGSKFYDDALYYKGLSHYKQDKFGPATIALKESMQSKAYRVKSLIALCYVYFKNENYASLIEVSQSLLKEGLHSRERRWVLHLLGEAQFNQKTYRDALETFTELLSITRVKEDRRQLKLKMAEIYLEMEDYELCHEFLQDEKDPEFRNLLADLNVRLGKIEEAKGIYLDVASSSFSEFGAEAFYKLAEIYRGNDSLEQAIAYYDSALKRSSLSEYGVKARKIVDVLRRIDALNKETENIDRAQFLLAEAYFIDLNNLDRAVVEYEKVHTDFPDSKWAPKAMYAQLWITKNLLNNDSLANHFGQELLKRYPNSEYAKSAENILAEGNNEPEGQE